MIDRDDDEVDDDVDPYDVHLSNKIVEAIDSGGAIVFEHFSVEFQDGTKPIVATLRDGRGGTGRTPGEALMRAVNQDPPAAIVRAFVETPVQVEPHTKGDPELLIDTLVAMVRRASGEMQSRQLREAFEADLKALLREHDRAS